jgi:hypothetical protein
MLLSFALAMPLDSLMPEPVVDAPSLLVRKNITGLIHLDELSLGLLIADILVRVILARQRAEAALDLRANRAGVGSAARAIRAMGTSCSEADLSRPSTS